MSERTDFRAIQQRTHRLMNFEDGLWDLLLGMIFMFLAFYPVTRQALGPVWNLTLFIALLAVLVVGQLLLRRYVSAPRIGNARPRRSIKMRLLMIFTLLMVAATLALVLVTLLSPGDTGSAARDAAPGSRGYLVELLVLLVTGGIFSVLGYMFGVTRVYFYGWLLGLANLASVYMEHTAGWTFLIPLAVASGIILVIGVVLLVRFLRTYPVRAEAA